MTKFHIVIIVLGTALFTLDFAYGLGWLFGWLFVGLLRHFREPILEKMIDFDDFSTRKYITYLLLVMAWIAVPLVISFILSDYINPLAVFGAFFADRMLMFVIGSFSRKEAR